MYLYENENFENLINLASQKLQIKPSLIEKDYWVCWVLRRLVDSSFFEEIIFKGGTAISKIWIKKFERFSEDIDLLLVAREQKRHALNKRLQTLINYVIDLKVLNFNNSLSTPFDEHLPIGGKFYFNYPGVVINEEIIGIKPQILLEPGYRGGIFPSSLKPMNSYIGNFINNNEATKLYQDIEPFNINTLNPERILLEKIGAIIQAKEGQLISRTRHFYDIAQLIPLINLDNVDLPSILEDINRISKTFYGQKIALTIKNIKEHPLMQTSYPKLAPLVQAYRAERGLYLTPNVPEFEQLHSILCSFVNNL